MAHIRNLARDVETGDAFLTGSADIFGPDGSLLASVPVNPSSGIWEYQVNGSPGATLQEFVAAGQTKIVDGSVGGQAGDWYELELPRILRLFSDGTIDGLPVTAPGGMAIQVGLGNLLNKGVIHPIYTAENVAIAAADPTNPRIDLIVSRLDLTGTFTGRLRLLRKAGPPAASPVAPAPVQDGTLWEVEVARVTVPAAAGSIILSNIDITQRPIASGPLSDGSVTHEHLADDSVGSNNIIDDSILLVDLNSEAKNAFQSGPGLVSTYWVSAQNVLGGSYIGSGLISGLNQNTLYGSPIFVPKATTLTGIGVQRLTTDQSLTLRFGLYRVASNGLPGALHHDAGTIVTATAGVKSKTGLSIPLPGGWYWGAICAGSFSGDLLLGRLRFQDQDGNSWGRHLVGRASIPTDSDANTGGVVLHSAQAVFSGTGALPATFPAPGLSSSGPLVWVQTSGT